LIEKIFWVEAIENEILVFGFCSHFSYKKTDRLESKIKFLTDNEYKFFGVSFWNHCIQDQLKAVSHSFLKATEKFKKSHTKRLPKYFSKGSKFLWGAQILIWHCTTIILLHHWLKARKFLDRTSNVRRAIHKYCDIANILANILKYFLLLFPASQYVILFILNDCVTQWIN
jgi:hypothetical protein